MTESTVVVDEYTIVPILDQARRAGLSAMQACQPQPMIVKDTATGQQWHVNDGACGFAWVNVHGIRKNSRLGRALIQSGGFRRNEYERTLQLWVREGNQSIELKEAYARAYARVLKDAGLRAYMGSRLD